jgi:hypothetical protein
MLRSGDTAAHWLTVRQHLAAANLAALLGGWAAGSDVPACARHFEAGTRAPERFAPPIDYLTELALACADHLVMRLNQPENPASLAPGDTHQPGGIPEETGNGHASDSGPPF